MLTVLRGTSLIQNSGFWPREKLGKFGSILSPFKIDAHDLDILRELGQNLPTGTAGSYRFL